MSYDEWKEREPQEDREYEDGPVEDYSDSEYLAVWREDFEALAREPDEEQKALERALETLHHK